MATNQYFNKVVNGQTGAVLVDLTADTVGASSLLSGATAHDASGAPVTGSVSFSRYYTSSSAPTGSQGANGDVWLVTS